MSALRLTSRPHAIGEVLQTDHTIIVGMQLLQSLNINCNFLSNIVHRQ